MRLNMKWGGLAGWGVSVVKWGGLFLSSFLVFSMEVLAVSQQEIDEILKNPIPILLGNDGQISTYLDYLMDKKLVKSLVQNKDGVLVFDPLYEKVKQNDSDRALYFNRLYQAIKKAILSSQRFPTPAERAQLAALMGVYIGMAKDGSILFKLATNDTCSEMNDFAKQILAKLPLKRNFEEMTVLAEKNRGHKFQKCVVDVDAKTVIAASGQGLFVLSPRGSSACVSSQTMLPANLPQLASVVQAAEALPGVDPEVIEDLSYYFAIEAEKDANDADIRKNIDKYKDVFQKYTPQEFDSFLKEMRGELLGSLYQFKAKSGKSKQSFEEFLKIYSYTNKKTGLKVNTETKALLRQFRILHQNESGVVRMPREDADKPDPNLPGGKDTRDQLLSKIWGYVGPKLTDKKRLNLLLRHNRDEVEFTQGEYFKKLNVYSQRLAEGVKLAKTHDHQFPDGLSLPPPLNKGEWESYDRVRLYMDNRQGNSKNPFSEQDMKVWGKVSLYLNALRKVSAALEQSRGKIPAQLKWVMPKFPSKLQYLKADALAGDIYEDWLQEQNDSHRKTFKDLQLRYQELLDAQTDAKAPKPAVKN